MFPGLFPQEELVTRRQALSLIPQCGSCKLNLSCKSPVMPVDGKGKAKILILGEAPGKEEDFQGRPFVGPSGSYLQQALGKLGIDLRQDCWITNSLLCFVSPHVFIYTSEGYKRIKDVQIGDLVLTHKGRFRKVASRSADLPDELRKNKGLLVEVKYGRHSLTVTADHLFLVEGEWKRADSLREGDLLTVMAAKCVICGKLYFKNPKRFDKAESTCSQKCHNVSASRKSGKAVSVSMKRQYETKVRDRYKITKRANDKVRDLASRGEWVPGEHRTAEGKARAYEKMARGRQRHNSLYEGMLVGKWEKEIVRYLSTNCIDFWHQYAIGCKNFDFLLTDYNLLVEVENPVTYRSNRRIREDGYVVKEGLANKDGKKVVFLHSSNPLEEIKRILKNDNHEYYFTTERVKSVTVRSQKRQQYLYCLEVEEDSSYISCGVVSHNCRPPNNKIPNPRCVDYCRPNLIQTVQDLKPELIIPLGKVAVSSLLGWVWKEDPGPISRWVGWQIPSQRLNAWIAPNYHPAHVLRADEKKGERQLLDKFFYRYLEQAIKLPARPWKEVPDYDKAVRRIYEVDRGAEHISRFIGGTPVAFDFETDRLKPDSVDSQIICCSMSNGRDTVAFPWQGPVIPAFKEFLVSNTPKIGANLKFEHRWCKRRLGVDVRNWVWDTVTNAHILDNRRGVTSVKFQAFVLLGAESYDSQMKAYMNSQGSNSPNRLKSAPLDKLLLYCGKDSLLEYEIFRIQSKQLGMKSC